MEKIGKEGSSLRRSSNTKLNLSYQESPGPNIQNGWYTGHQKIKLHEFIWTTCLSLRNDSKNEYSSLSYLPCAVFELWVKTWTAICLWLGVVFKRSWYTVVEIYLWKTEPGFSFCGGRGLGSCCGGGDCGGGDTWSVLVLILNNECLLSPGSSTKTSFPLSEARYFPVGVKKPKCCH